MAREERDTISGKTRAELHEEAARLPTGHEAIQYAREHDGATLCKYADPTEGERRGLTVDQAREVAAEDPSLIYIEGGRS